MKKKIGVEGKGFGSGHFVNLDFSKEKGEGKRGEKIGRRAECEFLDFEKDGVFFAYQ